jgi:hypothetical protein
VQLVNRPGHHLPGEILLELDRGLIGEVGAHFWFPSPVRDALKLTRCSANRRVSSIHNSDFCKGRREMVETVGGLAVWTRGCCRDGTMRDIRCSYFLGRAYRTTAHSLVTVRLILCNKQGGFLGNQAVVKGGKDSSEGGLRNRRQPFP